jgi:TRAP-type C4-dicarboxylate transport system substrate-binding protein
MRKSHLALAVAAVAASLGLAGSAVAADKPINIKLSYWVPPTHKLTPGYHEWADAVNKASGGSITVSFYPSSQLGSGKDEYDLVKRGIADFGLVNPGYTPGRFPVIGASDVPFTVSDAQKAAPVMYRWYKQYAAKEMPDVYVCHVFTHEPGQFHSRGPIKVPADIKGLNIRTANQTMAEYVTSLGGNSVQVPIMEAYDTLKRGITDGITSPWDGLIEFNFGKVTTYSLDIPLYVSTFVDVINKKLYDSMSPQQKKAIDSACTADWSARVSRFWHQQENDYKAKSLKLPGRTVLHDTPAELKEWRAAAKPVEDEWAKAVKKAGYDPETVRGDLEKRLKAAGAGMAD